MKVAFCAYASASAALALASGDGAVIRLPTALRAFTVPSAAMEPTLPAKTYLLVSSLADPARGDVIVFRLPRDGRTPYIKRIVGVAGDRLRFVKGRLEINGRLVKTEKVGEAVSDGVAVTRLRETLPNGASYDVYDQGPDHDGDDTDIYVVPKDAYFTVGDNRDNSLDSRWPSAIGVGFVPKANLIGKMVFAAPGRSK